MIKKLLLIFLLTYPQFSYSNVEIDFNIWLNKFKIRALKKGISEETINNSFKNTKYLKQVIKYDRYQPEFFEDTKTYIKKRATRSRMLKAKELLIKNYFISRLRHTTFHTTFLELLDDRGSLSNQSRSSFQAYKIGATQKHPVCQRPRLKGRSLHVRRRRHHGSGTRAAVSLADCGSTVAAPCDRLRRFLRPGLGLGFSPMIRSLSVSVRLSRHTDRGNRVPASG